MKKLHMVLAVVTAFVVPVFVSAHEVYVLSKEKVAQGLRLTGFDVIDHLHNPEHLQFFITAALTVLCGVIIWFFVQRTEIVRNVAAWLERFSSVGKVCLRLAVATSFFLSAWSGSFLGPELSLSALPYANVVKILMYGSSLMIALGLCTEIAAMVCLVVFTVGYTVFGLYLTTYISYVGELLVLLFIGSRTVSLDRLFFGANQKFKALEKYEGILVRVFYATALIFTAITVKFMHPHLTLDVVNEYQLTQFWLLFPNDPVMIVIGAAFVELGIGLFVLLGFELRLTVLISLFYLTLSLVFFKESVWPHAILFGASIFLLTNPNRNSLDSLAHSERIVPAEGQF